MNDLLWSCSPCGLSFNHMVTQSLRLSYTVNQLILNSPLLLSAYCLLPTAYCLLPVSRIMLYNIIFDIVFPADQVIFAVVLKH